MNVPNTQDTHLRTTPSFASVSRIAVNSRLRPYESRSVSPAFGESISLRSSARSSRRSSQVSSGGASSGGFSRSALASILSGGAAPEGSTASGPNIEGNLQILNAIEAGAHGEQVLSVTHNENGTVLIAGLSTGQIKVFHPTNGSLLATLDNEDINDEAFPISRVKCKPYTDGQPNSMLAATYVTGHLRVWNFGNGQCMAQVRDEDPEAEYLCLSHNPFVDVIAVGMANGHIKLYDEKTMQVASLLHKSLSPLKSNGHTDRVLSIANHPTNPHEFVSSGWDNTLQFWDARSPNSVRYIPDIFVCGEGLVFDRRGRDLMIASWRSTDQLKIIDYQSGKIVEKFDLNESEKNDPPCYLTCAQFIGKDHIVTCGTNRGGMKIIDRHKKSVVASISDLPNIYDLDVSKKTSAAAIAGTTGALKIALTSHNNVAILEFKR